MLMFMSAQVLGDGRLCESLNTEDLPVVHEVKLSRA